MGTLAIAGKAHAAVPEGGAWQSRATSWDQARVSFDVVRPAGKWNVFRLSFPGMCDASGVPGGWVSTTFIRAERGGRFVAAGLNTVIRGRFVTSKRAVVTVRPAPEETCKETRRYVVRRAGRRVAVRTGRWVSLVGGTAEVGVEVDAFGRMVVIQYMGGTVPARCSDGSHRPLTLAGPEGFTLASAINLSGRFEISFATAGASIRIGGVFDGASLGASVDLSVVLADGVKCAAITQPLVGSLVYGEKLSGERGNFSGPPAILAPTSSAPGVSN